MIEEQRGLFLFSLPLTASSYCWRKEGIDVSIARYVISEALFGVLQVDWGLGGFFFFFFLYVGEMPLGILHAKWELLLLDLFLSPCVQVRSVLLDIECACIVFECIGGEDVRGLEIWIVFSFFP